MISRAGSTTRIPTATTNISTQPRSWSRRARRPTSAKLGVIQQWELTEADENQRVWTDDYCNVLGAVYRRLRDGE